MAVVPMSRINIFGLKKNRKALMEVLQRTGVVELENMNVDSLSKRDTVKEQNIFSKAIDRANEALDILKKRTGDDSSLLDGLKGRKELNKDKYYGYADKADDIMIVVKDIIRTEKSVAESAKELIKLEMQKDSLAPWKNLDVAFDFSGSKTTKAFIGVFEGKKEYEQIYAMFTESDIPVDVDIISSSKEQTAVMIICLKRDEDRVFSLIRENGFSYPKVASGKKPADEIESINNKTEALKCEISSLEEKFREYKDSKDDIEFVADYFTMRLEKYKNLQLLSEGNKIFALTGYVSRDNGDKLKDYLEKHYDVCVEIQGIKEEEEPPVILRNNGFSAPVEGVLETFSLPGKKEIDPTFVMSMFYYVLFGLMLSDCAYGIIMTIGCALVLWRAKDLSQSLKGMLKMFAYCGIATAFWGLMFGSFFGDAVTVISETYFGKTVNFPTLWFAPIDNPMKFLIFAFAVGIIHLFAGLGMNLYMCIRDKRYKDGLYDVIFWYMLIIGLIGLLLSTEMFRSMANLSFIISGVALKIFIAIALIGAIGIVATGGRSSKSIGKRVAKGLYELYNVSGYLSDILSYSRLLALGLATGVIAEVFNMMGKMVSNGVGDGVLGFILFMIIFIVGHTLNIGINLLGAYVHTNRLQFVEFFGKFYEGSGKKFNPFKADTKYYKIKEEN